METTNSEIRYILTVQKQSVKHQIGFLSKCILKLMLMICEIDYMCDGINFSSDLVVLMRKILNYIVIHDHYKFINDKFQPSPSLL